MEQFVTTPDGRTLAVEDAGDRAGRPVLAHVGTPGGRRLYGRRMLADAERRQLRLISYDRPGYGNSTPHPGRSMADCASDVRVICAALGIDRLAMWGLSGGGPHVLACAALLPDLVCAAASLASLAPCDAERLDWLSGFSQGAIDEVRLMLADETEARALFLKEREQVVAASPAQVALDMQARAPGADLTLLTDQAVSMQQALAPGIEGTRDDWATEAYTRSLRGQARRVAALASHVIATEPIPAAAWLETGWPGRATGLELRVLYPYLQRTADNRLVIGGRSIGYRYGSAADATDPRVWETLRATIGDLFPAFAGAEITHRWSGVLGAYRDFSPRVSYDSDSGFAEAGGYVGDGVALANLAGRSLAALITGADRPEARLCWAGAPVARNWEPEPLRYLGIKTLGWLARSADAREQAGRPAGLRGKIVAAAMS
jgi:pimeloyl-ACP methyl ester carboxylesterase